MPYNERINYPSFLNNQSQIESEWDVDFGDRKIELVFIGQNLDVKSITKVLEDCLLTKEELIDWGNGDFSQYDDCLLYTSPSPRDVEESRMPSSA